MSLDAIRVVVAPDHPIVDVGKHILQEVRYLFEDLAPDMLLIEMALDNGWEPPLAQPTETAPVSPQTFVLRGYHNRAYVFGLLSSGPVTELTEHDALETIAEAIQAGRAGAVGGRSQRIVAKLSPRQLETAPVAMPDLTAREVEVLRQLTMGKTNRALSQDLSISEWTVRYHLKNIFRKLEVKRRSEAIAWVVRTGWGT